jgi:hypothetical protein
MTALKIDKAEGQDDGPWIRSEGLLGFTELSSRLLEAWPRGHRPEPNRRRFLLLRSMRENWEGDPAEDCGPNADFRGTRDAVAVEIARQWAAILDTPNGMSPKKGAIARPGEGSFQALSYN